MNTIEKLHVLRQLGQTFNGYFDDIDHNGIWATLEELTAAEADDAEARERVQKIETAFVDLDKAFDAVIAATILAIQPLDVRRKAEKQAERRAAKNAA